MRRVHGPFDETDYQILVVARVKGKQFAERTSILGGPEQTLAFLRATIAKIEKENSE